MIRSAPQKNAFTLVELLIVIIIIAVLAAILIPKFADSGLRSKEAALKADLKVLRNAVELFRVDTSAYPDVLDDLAATSSPANGRDSSGSSKVITATDWKGPYLHAVANDPVSGSAFNYGTGAPTVGQVTISASGTATDGTLYSDW